MGCLKDMTKVVMSVFSNSYRDNIDKLLLTDHIVWYIRYMNGAATNPDAHVFAYAAAQVKKGLEIAKKLGAENFGEK